MIRIAITGPESTGKTTLAKELSRHFNCKWVPEYARDFLQNTAGFYTYADLDIIAQNQIENWQKHSNDFLCFYDTEMLVMKVWSAFKYSKVSPLIATALQQQKIDLFLLCKPDIEWEKDDLREHPEKRAELYEIYHNELISSNARYRVIEGQKEERTQLAIKQVTHFLEHLAAGDVARDAHREDVADAHIEELLHGRAAVDAAEHHGKRRLTLRRALHLVAEVARERRAVQEALVADLQELEHVRRRDGPLHVARGVALEVEARVEHRVRALEAQAADPHAERGPRLRHEVADQVHDVRVDVVGLARVEEQVPASRDVAHRVLEGRAVQEAHLVGQLDAQHVAARVLLHHALHGAPQVAPQDEHGGDAEADHHAHQQVGEDDDQHGEHERQELLRTVGPHLLEQRGLRELEAGDQEDGREGRERDAVEQRRDQQHRAGEQDAVHHGAELGLHAGVDVHAAAHDDAGDRDAADQTGDHVAHALRHQLTVGGRAALLGVDLVGLVPGQPQQDGAVGTVADARGGQRAEQVQRHRRRAAQLRREPLAEGIGGIGADHEEAAVTGRVGSRDGGRAGHQLLHALVRTLQGTPAHEGGAAPEPGRATGRRDYRAPDAGVQRRGRAACSRRRQRIARSNLRRVERRDGDIGRDQQSRQDDRGDGEGATPGRDLWRDTGRTGPSDLAASRRFEA